MKPTDFAFSLQKFFREHMAHQRCCSENTIKSYRDTFKIFIKYMNEYQFIPPHKLVLSHFTSENIASFRKYIAKTRNCSEATRNQRMAAIFSFARFLQCDHPEILVQCQRIQCLPKQRSHNKPISYLSKNQLAALIKAIKIDSRYGMRDKTMILLLYDSGARVQEIADLRIQDIRLGALAQVTLAGKGGKTRIVPLMPTTVAVLGEYLKTFSLDHADSKNPFFCNQKKGKLSRFGIAYILQKYADKAKAKMADFPLKVTPHTLRHSKAMHLLEAGCSEIVIQHILGHSDIKTTMVYAKANNEMIRESLKKVNKDEPGFSENAIWQNDENILTWLESL